MLRCLQMCVYAAAVLHRCCAAIRHSAIAAGPCVERGQLTVGHVLQLQLAGGQVCNA